MESAAEKNKVSNFGQTKKKFTIFKRGRNLPVIYLQRVYKISQVMIWRVVNRKRPVKTLRSVKFGHCQCFINERV